MYVYQWYTILSQNFTHDTMLLQNVKNRNKLSIAITLPSAADDLPKVQLCHFYFIQYTKVICEDAQVCNYVLCQEK